MKPSSRLKSLYALFLGLSLLACDGTELPIELPRSVSLYSDMPALRLPARA